MRREASRGEFDIGNMRGIEDREIRPGIWLRMISPAATGVALCRAVRRSPVSGF